MMPRWPQHGGQYDVSRSLAMEGKVTWEAFEPEFQSTSKMDFHARIFH